MAARFPQRPLRAIAGLAAFGFGVVSYVYVTLPDVRPLATVNPTSTAFMRLREQEAAADGLKPRYVYRWVSYSRISPNLKRAVLVAEDSAFWDHEGIDVEEIRKSIQDSLSRGQAPRGASTITQQLAKNLYLSPSYDPLRKVEELIIARRLEAALTKTRILEIYLNVIEWGDRVWGAEAAARTYFGVSAASLSRQQSALLAGAIVNPRCSRQPDRRAACCAGSGSSLPAWGAGLSPRREWRRLPISRQIRSLRPACTAEISVDGRRGRGTGRGGRNGGTGRAGAGRRALTGGESACVSSLAHGSVKVAVVGAENHECPHDQLHRARPAAHVGHRLSVCPGCRSST